MRAFSPTDDVDVEDALVPHLAMVDEDQVDGNPQRRVVFQNDRPVPPTEIISSSDVSITSATSTLETPMFQDAQSQEDDLLKAELKHLEKDFEEQTNSLMEAESTARQLRDQLLQVQGERDSLEELRDESQGELESLRRRSETVLGLDMSLKAAIHEIDRLRKVKLTENEVERDTEMEESRLKVQALILEVTRLQNDLTKERRDKERIRKEMEVELAKMMEKLSKETREEFEQRLVDASQQNELLKRRLEKQEPSWEIEAIAKENEQNLRTELVQLQWELNEVRDSLKETRNENNMIREEAKVELNRMEMERAMIADERNQLEMDLSSSVDERNRLRFSIKEDGKVPREEVSKAVAQAVESRDQQIKEAVESRDQQIKELREQATQLGKASERATDNQNWVNAQLKVYKEEAVLLQRQLVDQQRAGDQELQATQMESRNAKAETDRLHKKLETVYSENQEMESEFETLRAKVGNLRHLNARAEAKASVLEGKLQETESRLESSEEVYVLLHNQLEAANETINAQNQRLREVEKTIAKKGEALVPQQEDIDTSHEHHESTTETHEQNESIASLEAPDTRSRATTEDSCHDAKDRIPGAAQDDDSTEDRENGIPVPLAEYTEDLKLGHEDLETHKSGVSDAVRESEDEALASPVVAPVAEEDSTFDAESVDTPKARGGADTRNLDSFEEHVHIWPRSWHDHDGQSKYGGRDTTGYGLTPPKPMWPNMAKVALNFVIHYEEGGEMCLLHGDTASGDHLTEIIGAPSIEGQRHVNIESMYDYGSRAGFWRMHRLFTSKQISCTVFAAGMALERNPQACRSMKEAGWEVASHGYRLMDYRNTDEKTQKEHIKRTIAIHQKLLGDAPAGIYLGSPSANTRSIVARQFYYDSDSYSDELPFWTLEGGAPHLVIPYTLTLNDMRFVTPNGFSNGQEFCEYLTNTLE
jgi:allantoinase